jgi:ATPase subunit of ABC transporter with duplicated ATPase domains
LALKQKSQENKKKEDRIKELQDFIARFSANASTSKQATSRKKALDKINLEDIKPSNRRYPGIIFNSMAREAGDIILQTEGLSKKLNGEYLFKDLNLDLKKGDKVALLSKNSLATSAFYKIISGEDTDFEGTYNFGVTINNAYVPIDNTEYFTGSVAKLNLIDWLRQYSEDKDETFVRGFLGRMLFGGEETLKMCSVLSGGEKQRCMFSKMMLEKGNLLLFDEPTSHLDMESIIALNDGMKDFRGNVIFTCHDHTLVQTTANRIVELGPKGYIDRPMITFDEYLEDARVQEMRAALN